MSMHELEALRAELWAALDEVQQVTDRLRADGVALRAELDAERATLRAAREEAETTYAEEARDGDAGRARQELQRRIDAEETTWRDVMSGADQHWSAIEVREEVVGDARAEVDRIELTDPEAAERYREHATLRRGDRIGEWTR